MATLTIFYDGGCPLCAAEITHLIRLNSENKLAFENIYAPDFAERFGHIDRQAADRVLHGQLATGEMIYGLDVTYEAWLVVAKGMRELAPPGFLKTVGILEAVPMKPVNEKLVLP